MARQSGHRNLCPLETKSPGPHCPGPLAVLCSILQPGASFLDPRITYLPYEQTSRKPANASRHAWQQKPTGSKHLMPGYPGSLNGLKRVDPSSALCRWIELRHEKRAKRDGNLVAATARVPRSRVGLREK